MAKDNKKEFISAVGRRRESIARVRLYEQVKELQVAGEAVKKGDIFINAKKASEYFRDKISQLMYEEPLKITNNTEKYAFTIKVIGGGRKGQLDALIHGMARALSKIDDKNRKILKKKGFLTRDPRTRQRRNVGMGGKSRRKKQSPKR